MLSRRRLLRHALSVPVAAALAKLPVADAEEVPSAHESLNQADGFEPGRRDEVQLSATPTDAHGRDYQWFEREWFERDARPGHAIYRLTEDDLRAALDWGYQDQRLIVSKASYRWLKAFYENDAERCDG
jgi:hypothetical protein